MLTDLICPRVQNFFFIDFRKHEPVSNFILHWFFIQKLNIPPFRTASGQRTFNYRTFILLWNNLEPPSFYIFLTSLKEPALR